MHQVILDTETTGLEPEQDHRIIEIGCIEIVNRRPTDRVYQQYLWPERDSDDSALEVHGITNEFLRDKPRFADIASKFLEFVHGAELVIHNAPFDVAFINAELRRLGESWGRIEDHCTILDTLQLAREIHPGQRNSLDALCRRYEVDDSRRRLHGALLDAEILAEVYLAMTGGQAVLGFDDNVGDAETGGTRERVVNADRSPLRIIEPTAEELAAHDECLAIIDEISTGKCVWLQGADSAS